MGEWESGRRNNLKKKERKKRRLVKSSKVGSSQKVSGRVEIPKYGYVII